MREELGGVGIGGLRDVRKTVRGEVAECMRVVEGIDGGGDAEVVAGKVVEVRYLERVLKAVERKEDEIGSER